MHKVINFVIIYMQSTEATFKGRYCYPDECQNGAKFNWQTCSCEGAAKPVLRHPALPIQPLPLGKAKPVAAFKMCTRRSCAPGQFFDYTSCQCTCLQNTACPGALQFSQQSCRCECTFTNFVNDLSCGPGQFFNTLRCRCEFLPTPPPTPPPTLPQIPACPAIACPAPQFQDPNTCRCVCPTSANNCNGRQFFNPNTCECDCSSSGRECNELQELNRRTCRCECVSVLPAPFQREEENTPSTRSSSTGTRSTSRSGTSRSGTYILAYLYTINRK